MGVGGGGSAASEARFGITTVARACRLPWVVPDDWKELRNLPPYKLCMMPTLLPPPPPAAAAAAGSTAAAACPAWLPPAPHHAAAAIVKGLPGCKMLPGLERSMIDDNCTKTTEV